MSPLLSDLTSPETAQRAAAGALLVVPIGSCEQHGPHLPLTTDADLAAAVARGLADRRDDVLVAPVMAYGASGEHDGFAGTLSIGVAATRQVLVELGRAAMGPFRRLLLLNGHGGNAVPVRDATALLRSEGRDVRAWSPTWAAQGWPAPDAHAGRAETSLQLALRPGAVDLAAAAPGDPRPLEQLMPALRAAGVRGVSPNGVLGDPAGASAAEGRARLAAAVDAVEAVVAAWPLPPGAAEPPAGAAAGAGGGR